MSFHYLLGLLAKSLMKEEKFAYQHALAACLGMVYEVKTFVYLTSFPLNHSSNNFECY